MYIKSFPIHSAWQRLSCLYHSHKFKYTGGNIIDDFAGAEDEHEIDFELACLDTQRDSLAPIPSPQTG